MGGTERIILSADSAESLMLSACAESMDTLSAGAENMIVSALPTESMILSAPFGRVTTVSAASVKKTTISNTDDCQLTTFVNSASMAPPIGLPPKGGKFCHTLNILLVGCRRGRALWRLFLNSPAVSWLIGRSLVGCWSVHNENCCAMTFGGE